MKNCVGRALAGIETVLIVLPVFFAALVALSAVETIAPTTDFPVQRRLFGGLVIAAPILCLCCGALIAILALSGREALLRAPAYLWLGTGLGIVVTLVGVAIALDYRLNWLAGPEAAASRFGIFSVGAPMLLPAFHIWWERNRRMPANNALEQARDE
jgi:hypothetical protein